MPRETAGHRHIQPVNSDKPTQYRRRDPDPRFPLGTAQCDAFDRLDGSWHQRALDVVFDHVGIANQGRLETAVRPEVGQQRHTQFERVFSRRAGHRDLDERSFLNRRDRVNDEPVFGNQFTEDQLTHMAKKMPRPLR